MRTLDCGCEFLQDTGQFMSLCAAHGGHVHMRLEAAKHPRHVAAHVPDVAFERELVKLIAPVIIARWSVVTDANSSAEAIFQHVKEIIRRLE